MNQNILFLFLIFGIFQTSDAIPIRFGDTILKLQALDINDLRGRQSRSTGEKIIVPIEIPRIRPMLLDLFNRVVSAGSLALIRPAEPLSSNENTLKWEKLGWSW